MSVLTKKRAILSWSVVHLPCSRAQVFIKAFLYRRKKDPLQELRLRLSELYNLPPKNIFLLERARVGLYLLLKTLKQKHEGKNEVILPSFTCVAVLNPVLKAGLFPVFCDIDPDTLNINTSLLSSKINRNTLAMIFQATFGSLVGLGEAKNLCAQKGIPVILDLAQGTEVPEDFEFVVLSFGRDKGFPCIGGGAVLIRDEKTARVFERNYLSLPLTPLFMDLKDLFYLLYMRYVFYPLFVLSRSLGSFFLRLGRLSGLVIPGTNKEERETGGSLQRVFRLSPLKASVLLSQWEWFLKTIETRKKRVSSLISVLPKDLVEFLRVENLSLSRFPLRVKGVGRSHLLSFFKKERVWLEEGWSGIPPFPYPNFFTEKIPLSDSKVARKVADSFIPLPLHLEKGEFERINYLLGKLFLGIRKKDEGF